MIKGGRQATDLQKLKKLSTVVFSLFVSGSGWKITATTSLVISNFPIKLALSSNKKIYNLLKISQSPIQVTSYQFVASLVFGKFKTAKSHLDSVSKKKHCEQQIVVILKWK